MEFAYEMRENTCKWERERHIGKDRERVYEQLLPQHTKLERRES